MLNHPLVQRGQDRLQVDPHLLLRRRAAAGRHQGALRGAHRRPHRRRLFADRSDDGLLRQSGDRAKTSSARSACRCPTSPSASSTTTRARAKCAAKEVGEICVCAPQLMTGYWNQPEETAIVLRDHADRRRHAAVPAHRRPRLPRRGRLPVHRRSEEGPDQDERLPGVAARDRGSDRRASGGRGGRRRRRPRRDQGRSGQGVGRAAGRTDGVRGRSARVLPRTRWRLTRFRRRSSSAPSCRRPWSARCCGGRCETAADQVRRRLSKQCGRSAGPAGA